MSRGTRNTLALIALLVAAASVFSLREESPTGRTDQQTTVSAPQPEANGGGATAAANSIGKTRPKRLALPPVDAPLATIIEPLAARADAGDTKAACRLAMELIRCRNVQELQAAGSVGNAALEIELEAKGDLDNADRIAQAQLDQARLAQECAAVPAQLQDRGPHYLGQAARAGEPEAMVRYADSQFWPLDGRGIYSDPEFERWRRDAPAMLNRAFAAGIPEAPFILMNAYDNDYSLVGGLIPNDPIKAEALRMLMVRLHGWSERLVPSTLDAASLARARRLAKQWHDGPFKGRSYRGQKRAMFQPTGFPNYDGSPHAFCVDDPPAP
jgi:hypothetical protein